MKLFAAADIHGAQYRLNILLSHIETCNPDLVIICGDVTQFGPGEVAKNFLNQIPVETFAIPGNIDAPEVGAAIHESNATNIHLKRVVKNGLSFVGIGGSVPSPLSTVKITDNDTKKSIEKIVDENTVLVTHEPPYRLQDKVFMGHHAGNQDLRDLIDKCKPKLVLCGHIHEDPGITTSNGTTVVNCSIGKRTEGAVIKIDDKVTVKMLD